MMRNLLTRTPRHSIPETKAIEIAKSECRVRGWPWLEPVRVTYRWGRWRIQTNHGLRGLNVQIVLHGQTGSIISATLRPR